MRTGVQRTARHETCALVVDESLTMRMYLASLLERQGWRTELACDADDAWRALKANGRFDLATVDWDTAIDGPSWIAAVRADPRFQQMRVLMVSARESVDEIEKALSAGADDYLMKPVTPAALWAKLRWMFGAAAGA
jgi:two-component system chemotaxis response regulator CheY